jgi:hypothetical protein
MEHKWEVVMRRVPLLASQKSEHRCTISRKRENDLLYLDAVEIGVSKKKASKITLCMYGIRKNH